MRKSEKVFYVNYDILLSRIEYMKGFSSLGKPSGDILEVGFPKQSVLSVEEAFMIFSALSKSNCAPFLKEINIEALVYFAHYFLSPFLLGEIVNILVNQVQLLPRAIKTASIYMLDSKFYYTVLCLATDILEVMFYSDVIELMYPEGKIYADPSDYVLTKLTKKLRNKKRFRCYKMSIEYMTCMLCSSILVISPHSKDVSYMKCCEKPVHTDCYKMFLVESNFVLSKKCVYCGVKWAKQKIRGQDEYRIWLKKNAIKNSLLHEDRKPTEL